MFACILMSDLILCFIASRERQKTKLVSWLGSIAVTTGMLGCLAQCWRLTVVGAKLFLDYLLFA